MSVACAICSKEPDQENEYCAVHSAVVCMLTNAFNRWQDAYGELSVNDFLSRVVKLPETGDAAKEAADFFLRNPGRWK